MLYGAETHLDWGWVSKKNHFKISIQIQSIIKCSLFFSELLYCMFSLPSCWVVGGFCWIDGTGNWWCLWWCWVCGPLKEVVRCVRGVDTLWSKICWWVSWKICQWGFMGLHISSKIRSGILNWVVSVSCQMVSVSCRMVFVHLSIGSEAVPEGIIARISNLEMQPLWDSGKDNVCEMCA